MLAMNHMSGAYHGHCRERTIQATRLQLRQSWRNVLSYDKFVWTKVSTNAYKRSLIRSISKNANYLKLFWKGKKHIENIRCYSIKLQYEQIVYNHGFLISIIEQDTGKRVLLIFNLNKV